MTLQKHQRRLYKSYYQRRFYKRRYRRRQNQNTKTPPTICTLYLHNCTHCRPYLNLQSVKLTTLQRRQKHHQPLPHTHSHSLPTPSLSNPINCSFMHTALTTHTYTYTDAHTYTRFHSHTHTHTYAFSLNFIAHTLKYNINSVELNQFSLVDLFVVCRCFCLQVHQIRIEQPSRKKLLWTFILFGRRHSRVLVNQRRQLSLYI